MHFAHISSPKAPTIVCDGSACCRTIAGKPPARRRTPLRTASQPPIVSAEEGRLITKTGYGDWLQRLATKTGYNGEFSESRDAAKDASHPADTHESTNAFW